MPLSLSTVEVTPERLDELLAAGYRRSGWYYYRTRCPACAACEPVRIEVAGFALARSQKRALARGRQHLRVVWSPPSLDATRVRLFNKHRQLRSLGNGERTVSTADYQAFLVNASCQALELQLWLDEKLLAVSVTDVGRESLSAVYCYFDPDYSWLSLGTYAILSQIQAAQEPGSGTPFGPKKWLYLGLYVQQNNHLNYKAKFGPQQRFIGGSWRSIDRHADM